MRYAEIQPSPALAHYVECFWTLCGDRHSVSPPAEPIPPDGRIEIVLNFADRFRRRRNGRWDLQPQRFVVGQMEESVLVQPTGRVDFLGIRFRHEGAFPILRIPLGEITGSILPLDELVGTFDRTLAEQAGAVSSTAARIACVERALLERAQDSQEADARLRQAVRAIEHGHGALSISHLARDLGVHSRKLERDFHHWVGLAPKRLARILRFQSVFRAVEQSPAGGEWAAVAAECGYFDQAHLIRDFRELSGLTPAALFSADMLLTRYFTGNNSLSNSYNPSR
jgi:AraC-like DNA-binding protein